MGTQVQTQQSPSLKRFFAFVFLSLCCAHVHVYVQRTLNIQLIFFTDFEVGITSLPVVGLHQSSNCLVFFFSSLGRFVLLLLLLAFVCLIDFGARDGIQGLLHAEQVFCHPQVTPQLVDFQDFNRILS